MRSNHRVPGKNLVDSYGAPVFAPDLSATVLAQPKSVLTPFSILWILDFYGAASSKW
jgi:hypothetical protein